MSVKKKICQKTAEFISIVFHPIFIPFYTVVVYLYLSPRYFIFQNIKYLVLYLLIVSIIIPLLFFAVMYLANFFSGFDLKTPTERLFMTIILLVVYINIFRKILNYSDYIELYSFFLGIILSLFSVALYNYFQHKPSLHTMAISGSLTFFLIWSYYSNYNILAFISIIILLASLIVSSRLYLKAHGWNEIIRGLLIGMLMQLFAFFIAYEYF